MTEQPKTGRFFEALREVEGLVLAFIGLMILWAFSAFGVTIPLLWNVIIIIVIVAVAVLLWRRRRRAGRE